MQAIEPCHALEFVLCRASLALEHGEQGGGNNRGGDAVLIAHARGIGAKTDGFFIAEVEPRNACDPLEASERVLVLQAVSLSNLAQQTRGNDRVCEDRILGGASCEEFAQQRARFIAGKLTPTGRRGLIGNRERTAVSIWVNRDDEV